MGDALRHASPKPKKKKQRPPWVDNSIPCLPPFGGEPFTSDPGPIGFDSQDVAGTPGDEAAEGDANAAAPATPLAAPHPSSSPVSSKQKQPPSPSRIPRHPDKAPLSTGGTDRSVSRIPHLTPSDAAQASSSPPRQRKHWGAPVAAEVVAPLAAAGVPVQPPQLRRGSPVRPASDAPLPEAPPSSSVPSTPQQQQQQQQPGSSSAHPSPISALRASAMESLKEGRHRAIQSRSPMHANMPPAAAPGRRSLSVEELPRPGSWDEADPKPVPKRSSYTQLPHPLPPSSLEVIPDSPVHASPRTAAHPHSTSQPITEAEGGDAKPPLALGRAVATSVDGAAAAFGGPAAEEAQGVGGAQQGGARKEGYLRKLSALKRTVAPALGLSPPHSQGSSSQAAVKQARPQLPPVLEPAANAHGSGAGAQQQEQPSSPSGRLHITMPRPVSEPAPAALEARQGGPLESRPRRVSDQGSPTKAQQAPNGIEGGPFGWRGQHDGAGPGFAGGGGPASDRAVPPAAAAAAARPPAGAAGAEGAAAAGGGGGGRTGRARWQVAPETRQAAWRWEGDASALARSSSSPFPDACKLESGAPTPPPHKPPTSSPTQPVPVPSNGKASPQQGSCSLPPASPLLANSPSRPAARPSSPSPHSSLQRPPTTHQEISAAAASAAAHGYTPAPLTGSAAPAHAPIPRRISAPGLGPMTVAPPNNASRKPPPHTPYPHNPLPPASDAWLPPSAFTDHGRPPTHPQAPWSLPPYPPGAPSVPASFTHSNTGHDYSSLPPRVYHHQPNATVPRSMVGSHHPPLHNAPLYNGYPSGYLTTQPSIPMSISSSPAATPPWMTLRDPSANANGNYNHKHYYGGLDAALIALQQQQQQQHAQYGARRTTINGHAQVRTSSH
uniref:Uncharacterized protein n=1 Tax=Dunaliella tertiolecta TaxID=3047 RepID=A0A7S3QUN8_DUNTE